MYGIYDVNTNKQLFVKQTFKGALHLANMINKNHYVANTSITSTNVRIEPKLNEYCIVKEI